MPVLLNPSVFQRSSCVVKTRRNLIVLCREFNVIKSCKEISSSDQITDMNIQVFYDSRHPGADAHLSTYFGLDNARGQYCGA